MAVYYDNTSLKAKHERKRSLEELTKENKELKTRLQATEDDLTNTQVALADEGSIYLSHSLHLLPVAHRLP